MLSIKVVGDIGFTGAIRSLLFDRNRSILIFIRIHIMNMSFGHRCVLFVYVIHNESNWPSVSCGVACAFFSQFGNILGFDTVGRRRWHRWLGAMAQKFGAMAKTIAIWLSMANVSGIMLFIGPSIGSKTSQKRPTTRSGCGNWCPRNSDFAF